LAQWFLRKDLNDPNPFLHFFYYLPFDEDLNLYLSNLEFPLPKDDLLVHLYNNLKKFNEIGLLVLEKIFKNFQCIYTLLP
jgi:hypothetical protein